MTAVEIASNMIDKLQEENNIYLDTLYRARDIIKNSERQLAKKDVLIRVLEDRLRTTGTDRILEMTNQQKALTIKHLELQIQRLLRENEELEFKINAIKTEVCLKCETKLFDELYDNKSALKPYQSKDKISGALLAKKITPIASPNCVKLLERIIEHKDKRITHLSTEIQRLTKTEKELTQKIYRLTKLLPMSRLNSEILIDSLLTEIQLLESQKFDDKFQLINYLN